MAKEYSEKLSKLITDLFLNTDIRSQILIKHFFNGAAIYIDGVICASWSPVSFAIKLPQSEAEVLISNGQAKPLKYFPKGHVKKEYVLFDEPHLIDRIQLKKYLIKSFKLT
jgi:TfoX/Sxy family transcriptional regulator of competence genes